MCGREQAALQGAIVGQRPAQAGTVGTSQVVGHGRIRQPGGGADLAAAQAVGQAKAPVPGAARTTCGTLTGDPEPGVGLAL